MTNQGIEAGGKAGRCDQHVGLEGAPVCEPHAGGVHGGQTIAVDFFRQSGNLAGIRSRPEDRGVVGNTTRGLGCMPG